MAARSSRVAEGPSVEERRRSWLGDAVVASLPSLVLVLLCAVQPQPVGGYPSTALVWLGVPVGLAIVIPFAAVQWLAALGAVRAGTTGRRAAWVLVWVLCVAGIVLGPAVLLMLQNLTS